MKIHIEPKQRIPEADAIVLEQRLLPHVGRELTAADAAALSGLPLDAAEAGLIVLARRYPARIRVTDRGLLLVCFASLTRARGPSGVARLATWLRNHVVHPIVAALTIIIGPLLLIGLTRDVIAVGHVAMQGGWFWLVAIPCMFIGAFAALTAILTALVFVIMPLAGLAMFASGCFIFYLVVTEPDGAGAVIFGVILGLVMIGFGGALAVAGGSRWLDTVIRKPTWARRLWQSVVVFLFGQARPEVDVLADERQLVALIRHRGGLVTTSDLIDLFGWTPDEADQAIARILCDYGGDVIATDEGGVVYDFTDPLALSGPSAPTGSVLATAGVEVAPPEQRLVVKPEPFFALGRGVSVFVLVTIGLGALGVLLHPHLPLLPGPTEWIVEMPELATDKTRVHLFGLGLWPYALVVVALGLRVPFFVARRIRLARRRRLERYLTIAGGTPEGAPMDDADLGLVARLGGDYDAGRLSFPRLAADRAAADRLRRERTKQDAPLGDIVFTSEAQ